MKTVLVSLGWQLLCTCLPFRNIDACIARLVCLAACSLHISISLIQQVLRVESSTCSYGQGRSGCQFVTNVPDHSSLSWYFLSTELVSKLKLFLDLRAKYASVARLVQ